jgi:hypothetical protein
MKTFTEYLNEGTSLMKDKKAVEFVNKVVKERLNPVPKYSIKNIEKAWKRKNGLGVIFEIHYEFKSYVTIDTYKVETSDINGNIKDVILSRLDSKKINKPSDDDWEN